PVARGHRGRAIASTNRKLNACGAALSDEQIAAIEHMTEASALSCVVGLAGTGKSTLLDTARRAWEAEGYAVYGASLAGKAADGLQSASGIKSRTLASLEKSWQSGYEPIPPGSVLVIDEVGMVGTRQLSRIMAELDKRNCKAVLVGDPDQLQPIEAGTPFRDVLARQKHACLTEIRRQGAEWQRQASQDLAAGDLTAGLEAYAARGHVHEARSTDHAITKLAASYLEDDTGEGSQLALAHRRRDVFALNQAIRAGRKAAGHLEGEMLVETDHGARAFAMGDRVLFTRNDPAIGVKNGMLGTVEAIDGQTLRVALDDGHRRVQVSTTQYRALDHGYAVSIHKSQGSTVDRTYVLGSKTLDQHLTYVAATRHRTAMELCTTPGFSWQMAGHAMRAGRTVSRTLQRGM
ncbi:MAG: AAA family ATPase, partial [Pseudomonadota bacterium]